MKRKVIASSLAACLIVGAPLALADRDHRGNDNRNQHDYRDRGNSNYGQSKHRSNRYNDRDYYRKYDRSWRGHDYWRRPWHGSGYNYYADAMGAALVGAAVSYALYHSHDGASCYEDHGYSSSSYGYSSSDSYRVAGCHRIEQLPDGTVRRIEMPLSACY